VNAAFVAWLATATSSGGCNGARSHNGGTTGPDACGGSKVVTFTYTSSCAPTTTTCSATFTVAQGCLEVLCTYTQGAFGNEGGNDCDGEENVPTATLIANSIATWGGTLTIGSTKNVTVTAANVQTIFDVLPGGGKSRPFDHSPNSINISALPDDYLKNGTINNTLFAQTLTLGLNLGISGGLNGSLGSYAIESGKYLVTAATVECGSTEIRECEFECTPNLLVPGTYIWTVSYNPYFVGDPISAALYAALPTKDIKGLYTLANNVLGGSTVVSAGLINEIASAVDMINNAFDECRSIIGWRTAGNIPSCTLPSATTPCPPTTTAAIGRQPVSEVGTDNLKVSAYPNPYNDVVRFNIESNVSGQAQLEVFNMLGQKVKTVYNGYIQANRAQLVEYKVPTAVQENLIYILRIGDRRVTGKLLRLNKQ